ncbi:hypothetical protein C8R43DRAFT_916707 [Mycena crocata]|nr:hypothetical protein C8R43DRAFT_916707 [Mycena crocata]
MPELIFVTGASGFIGSHVVIQLLEKGYRVRASTREAKAEILKSTYASYGDQFQIVKITDIAHEQFPEALIGVDAIIHIASPLPGRSEPDALFAAAVDGTLNILAQGEKAGVRRMVVTSSIAAVMNPEKVTSLTDQDWNPVTKEFAVASGNKVLMYAASKTIAERAVWEWADKHPHVDVTTLLPPFVFGPFVPGFPTPDYNALSSLIVFDQYLWPEGAFPYAVFHIDIRDIAQAHVRALTAPSTAEVGRKRLLISSPTGMKFQQTLDFIAEQRPALKERLAKASPPPEDVAVMPMDYSRLETVLGMKASDFRTVEKTYLDTIDTLMKVEDEWRSAGRTIPPPPTE